MSEPTSGSEPSLSGLKAILLEARTLTGAARQAYLDRVCHGNPALREEIESLLAFESAVPSLLDDGGLLQRLKDKASVSPTVDLGPDGPRSASADAVDAGEEIGPYRLVELLGEGGMGVVYRAEQVTPIRRDVALKLIRRGLDTDRIVARFESERQALARMDHPGIARVLDAGASADGRPYFVMELVQGAPITDFADRERLTLRQRIELAIDVCHAVQHAHQKGIIHRDLKPSNILVSAQDGALVPKVIDFGIAKAIEDPLTDYTLLTRAGQFIGTPDYMSPEQAGVLAVDVDTRTDVYALGVLLYELLSGRRPHQFERRTQDEVQAVLRSQEPERPSTGLSGRRRLTRHTATLDDAERQRIAESRRTTADRLYRQLAGDLDNIVLKAMQKEPVRRYGSVEQLAGDLQRYLDGQPVLARPDTWAYRTEKFVRRHSVGVGFAAAAMFLLVAFAVTMAIQSARIARERDRALAAEQRARIEAETAQEVSDFLVNLFRLSDPQRARGETVTAREILDRGAQRIGSELTEKPRVQAKLLYTLGAVYKQLGMYDDAATLMAQSVSAHERAGSDELEESVNELGDIERYRGRLAEGETLLRRALEMRRERFGTEHEKVGQALNNLALVLDGQGKLEEAEVTHREALRIREAVGGSKSPSVSNSLSNLGIVLRKRGKYDDAEKVLRDALALRRETNGANHPLVANTLHILGNVLTDIGNYAGAEPLYREALAIRRKVLGAKNPLLSDSIGALAGNLQDQNKLDQAEPLYLEAMTIDRALASESRGASATDSLAQTLNNTATFYQLRGDYRRAEQLFQESLAIRRTLRGDRHPSVALVMNNLAKMRLAAGQLASAERLAREALALRIDLLGPTHQHTAITRAVLGSVLHARGALAAAEEQFREALAFRGPQTPADHPALVQIHIGLARVLIDRRQPAAAEPLLRSALAVRQKRLAPTDARLAEVQVALARALLAQGKSTEAAPLLASSNQILQTAGPAHETLKRDAALASASLQQASATVPRPEAALTRATP